MQQIINKYPQLNTLPNPYIFLKQELDLAKDHQGLKHDNYRTYHKLKNSGFIRHCKPLRNGKFYDYIVKKEYDTIEDWVASYNPTGYLCETHRPTNRPTLRDVCYGRNNNLYPRSLPENHVMPFADAKVVPPMDSRLQDLANHLRTKKMNADAVMVNFNGLIMPLNSFMHI